MNHKKILAIDPGPEKSACVIIRDKEILTHAYLSTTCMGIIIGECNYDILVVEGVTSRGKKMGPATVKTSEIAGLFCGFAIGKDKKAEIIYRDKNNDNGIRSVRACLCGRNNAKETEVNNAVKELLPGCWIDGKKYGPLFMKIDGKYQYHKLAAAAAALTYQGSEQYKRICQA